MGRKGGGRAGFMKAARPATREEEQEAEELSAAAPGAAPAAPSPAAAAPVGSKAAAFLKDVPAPALAPTQTLAQQGGDEGSSGEAAGEGGDAHESRGHLVQRHKREQKALKDQVKRLGKKGREEAARLEGELARRQAEELAALEAREARLASGAAVVAAADSLYAVHLDGGGGAKPTKAQKRREARTREEGERDARIAAELEAMGDSDRVVEARALAALLLPLGLAVREVPADGHCLYRSVEDQVAQLPAPTADELGAAAGGAGGAPSCLQLRAAAAEHMRSHADAFRPFVLPEDASAPADGGEDAFQAYCREVEATAAWGGQPELQALAQALRCHIVVYAAGMPAQELGQEFAAAGRPTLRLCYLRHAYGLGAHYNSVQPGGLALDGEGSEGGEEGEEGSEEGEEAA
eukprot:scaffold3.g6748.t1